MHIAVLCATQRGLRCVDLVSRLAAHTELTVCTFREEPHEPPFLEDIRALTVSRGGRFVEARNANAVHLQAGWQQSPVDLLLAISWRYLVPREFYSKPKLGAFAFHDSYLPSYRGFSPTVWSLINGEASTGASLFWMADDMDSGDIVDQQRVAIGPDDTIAVVMEKVTATYLDLLKANLGSMVSGQARRQPQDHSQATFTCKRLPSDNRIDWSRSTHEIHNLIRATTRPYPGAFTCLDGRRLIVWQAARSSDEPNYVGRIPGRVVERLPHGVRVLTGDGSLILVETQFEGSPPEPATAALTKMSMTLGR